MEELSQMKYRLGRASKKNLNGVNVALRLIVNRAIEITWVDFSVVDGKRTDKEQAELLSAGKTWTLDSKHLIGYAVDIYPWVNGATSHLPEHYNLVARAMFQASQELGIVLEWGGFWSPDHTDMPHWQMV